jgi:probable rRNA maturation factor
MTGVVLFQIKIKRLWFVVLIGISKTMQAVIINQTKIKLNQPAVQSMLDLTKLKLSKNKTLKNLKKLNCDEISLVFISVPKMKKLNHEFRGKNYATDVLSFAPNSADKANESVGELIFCVAVLKKQALQHKHSFDHELLYMLIHGVLHLLGYDHEKSKKAALKMFTIQDRLFSQLTDSKINLKLSHVNNRRSQ